MRCTRPNMLAMVFTLTCVTVFSSGQIFAAGTAEKILKSFGREGGLFVVIGSGDAKAPGIATDLGENGNSLVHAIAGDAKELAAFNKAIADKKVKGCVSAEQLGLATLPYRDFMVNVMVIADLDKAKKAGLKMEEVRRCMAPFGRLVLCKGGEVDKIEEIPVPKEMDVWTHRYYKANGIPVSNDQVFDLPVGFRWNAGLPMNFDNPKRSANRYSSTRAMLVDDGRCFTFSTAVTENLGDGWKSPYGTDQYLTCRDAFNGRMLWRKRIGATYYGGLYIENLAPMVSAGEHIYVAGEDGKMLAINKKTGETDRELPTKFIPGQIAADDGVVVVATWKDGKSMGSVARYDRRRMDWEIGEGTIEAYDVKSGKLLWKNDLLGTALLISDGQVLIVSRSEKDELEKNHNKKKGEMKHPSQRVIAMDLKKGDILWQAEDKSFNVKDQAINLEAAGYGVVAVAYNGRKAVALLSAETGKLLDADAAKEVGQKFFRYRNHICTPVFRVNKVVLNNRGGNLSKEGGMNINFGGARAACLTGTVPGYGAGYIAQNWCKCSPGQIPGLLAIAPIGKIPTPDEMQVPTEPATEGKYNDSTDGITSPLQWTSSRGNAERSNSAACEIASDPSVIWTQKVCDEKKQGTVARDWGSYLNTRLTAPIIFDGLAIVGDIDHNEIVAVNIEDGKVKWRFPTGGRVDSAPTLYKGICLIGDHTGYVYAVKARTGELIYRLRIAPEEKRMVSYGKVESVWPVVGGVMVVDGKAYASAGRTQGSDGGLLVRAFEPETGKHLWAKALPAAGRQVRRNDTLIHQAGTAMLMGNCLKLDSGEPDPAAAKKGRAVSPSLEGIYSWNWTRVGHRKFGDIGYGGVKGDTVSWNDKYIAACDRNSKLTLAYIGGDAKEQPKAKQQYAVPAHHQVTSLVVCNNVVLLGGALTDQDKKGFIMAVNLKDATLAWEKTFDAKLAFNGLAADSCGIIASFDDGSVARLK